MERVTPVLPDGDWRGRIDLDHLYAVLGASDGEARLVGGVVRDALLGIPCADVDVATVHPPQTVLERLKAAGIRAVPTGLAHGTITAVLEIGPIEVTTLRRDLSTDGRHAIVAFTDDWQADAARRDFTINALYADPLSGVVHDYFEGLTDLAARRVRFIGDPYQRIAEDHLRILRFFRFHARFGDAIDTAGLDACTARANDLMALSRERIASELLKLLVAANAVPVVTLMVERGILKPVLPEVTDPANLARVAEAEAVTGITPDPIRRLAALLPRDSTVAEAIGARLKLSNAQRKRLVAAMEPPEGTPEALAYRFGKDTAIDRVMLWADAPIDSTSAPLAIRRFEVPRFPLTGGMLVEQGVRKGPDVARLLRAIEERWIGEGFPSAERVTQLAEEAVGTWLRASSSA